MDDSRPGPPRGSESQDIKHGNTHHPLNSGVISYARTTITVFMMSAIVFLCGYVCYYYYSDYKSYQVDYNLENLINRSTEIAVNLPKGHLSPDSGGYYNDGDQVDLKRQNASDNGNDSVHVHNRVNDSNSRVIGGGRTNSDTNGSARVNSNTKIK